MTTVEGVTAPVTGGQGSFEEFYTVGYGRLAAQLYAYLGDAAEAEDLAQEAYLRAWRRWQRVSLYDDPFAWVTRVGWNLATSRLRRLNVAARFVRASNPHPAVLAGLGPERAALVVALRQLPARHRLVVVLHYLGDQSVTDIAAELGVPRGSVLSWLHRGRARLAVLLDDSSIDGDGEHG